MVIIRVAVAMTGESKEKLNKQCGLIYQLVGVRVRGYKRFGKEKSLRAQRKEERTTDVANRCLDTGLFSLLHSAHCC